MGGEEKEVDETSMGSPQRRAHMHQRTLHTHTKKKKIYHPPPPSLLYDV